jgi:hypothetical protein
MVVVIERLLSRNALPFLLAEALSGRKRNYVTRVDSIRPKRGS